MISAIVKGLNSVLLELTPLQRWDAVHRGGNAAIHPFIIIISITVIVVLTVVLVATSLRRTKVHKKSSDRFFKEYANTRGLTAKESQLLWDIATMAGLKRSESIFTLLTVFERSAGQMLEETVRSKGQQRADTVKNELDSLREKLGFKSRQAQTVHTAENTQNITTRQIPIGKKIYIKHPTMIDAGDIESTAMKNDEAELAIRFDEPVEITLDQTWRGRYYAGPSVWEFDTSVIGCSGNIVVLRHSDDVRVINRRRYLRVPVKKPAYVANFPFAKEPRFGDDVENPQDDDFADELRPPAFAPAVVTELGGPGLRVTTGLQVKIDDRVLLIFKLDKKTSNQPSDAVEEIVESLGIVKNVRPDENGYSIAIELTDLNDEDLNELIRATNAASISVKNADRQLQTSSVSIGRISDQDEILEQQQ